MIALIVTLIRFFTVVRASLEDPEFRGLGYLVPVLLGGGTSFYHFFEGWTWIDAFYFSAITLSTVGYGDLHPTHAGSKIFTAVYVLVGVGVLVAFGTRLVAAAALHPGVEGEVVSRLRGLGIKRDRDG